MPICACCSVFSEIHIKRLWLILNWNWHTKERKSERSISMLKSSGCVHCLLMAATIAKNSNSTNKITQTKHNHHEQIPWNFEENTRWEKRIRWKNIVCSIARSSMVTMNQKHNAIALSEAGGEKQAGGKECNNESYSATITITSASIALPTNTDICTVCNAATCSGELCEITLCADGRVKLLCMKEI